MPPPGSPRHGPPPPGPAPRYVGVRTFARVPHVQETDGVDVACVGIPFDTATTYRPGARFGPEAIRANSVLLRPYDPELGVDVFARLSIVDWGDVPVVPGNASKTLERITDTLSPIVSRGVTPLVFGGDHSVTLGELRALALEHGPVALLLFDAHADTWEDSYGERYFHSTVFRRATEEGLVDPTRSTLVGMRGPLFGAGDVDAPRELGFEVVPGRRLADLSPAELAEMVSKRARDGAMFLSFDIDVIDPAWAPATGTPEVAGLTPHQALAYLRALAELHFVGFDIVEVAPAYDGPGQPTAMLAANIAWLMLALQAARRRVG
jgi:agmatinase